MIEVTLTAILDDGSRKVLGTYTYADNFPDIESDVTAQARAYFDSDSDKYKGIDQIEIAGEGFGVILISARQAGKLAALHFDSVVDDTLFFSLRRGITVITLEQEINNQTTSVTHLALEDARNIAHKILQLLGEEQGD